LTALVTSGTYQYKALAYVQSLSTASSLSTAKAVQLYALACLYYSTYAVSNAITASVYTTSTQTLPGWNMTTNWLSKTIDPCSGNSTQYIWYGIQCASEKITTIDLYKNRLSGSVPYEITLLSADSLSGAGNLNSVDLERNPLLYNHGTDGLAWIAGLGSNLRTCV
jgi:hypothetical protein